MADLPPEIPWALAAVLGLLVGSFLNVVIHRLPLMLQRRWQQECAELLAQSDASAPSAAAAAGPPSEPFNLLVPRSRCGHCGHRIAWYENVPVLSYLWLKGRCSACAAPIGWRYPAVELATGLLWGFCAWKWGWGWTALAWAGLGSALLALAAIDWDTTLLPDDITLPLVWAGLCAAALRWTGVALSDALWGAVAGYGSLWAVFWAFKWATGREGMGYGDFKLFAALGAWFGWQALIPIILMSSVIGAVVGLVLKWTSGLREGGYIPFGPFLALAGLTALVWSPRQMLSWVGL